MIELRNERVSSRANQALAVIQTSGAKMGDMEPATSLPSEFHRGHSSVEAPKGPLQHLFPRLHLILA